MRYRGWVRSRAYLCDPHWGVAARCLDASSSRPENGPVAKTTIVEITDDLDGSKDAVEVSFAFQGTEYTIDLGKKNAAAFEKALKPYIDAATRVPARRAPSTRRRTGKSSASGPDLADVRSWAKENGVEVSGRGRVPQNVIDQYLAAH